MKASYLKWISIAFIVAIICIAFVFLSMNSTQSKKMSEIARDLSYYYQISCPNGNVLCITSSGNLKYDYNLSKYSFSLTESEGTLSYKSVTDILGNTKFYHTGLLSGSSSMNYETDFPQCVIKINDSTDSQRFFYPTYENNKIIKSQSNGGKIYISFDKPISYDETISLVAKMEEYGIVTWMWVDTYGQSSMDTNPITLQNPSGNGTLPVHGIPLYDNGNVIENPLKNFLNILNNACSCTSENYANKKLKEIKLGINNSNEMLCEESIKIIGVVLLPYSQSNNERDDTFQFLNKIDNVRLCS